MKFFARKLTCTPNAKPSNVEWNENAVTKVIDRTMSLLTLCCIVTIFCLAAYSTELVRRRFDNTELVRNLFAATELARDFVAVFSLTVKGGFEKAASTLQKEKVL